MTEFSRNSNFSPTLPPHPLTIPVDARKPPVLWSNSDNSRLSCRADYPPKQLALGSGLSGSERMTSFPLLPSFLQAFLSPWAERCEPWWDKQRSCVIINHKGMAHTGVHGEDAQVSASGVEILKEPSSMVKLSVNTPSRDQGDYLMGQRPIVRWNICLWNTLFVCKSKFYSKK